MFCFLSAPHSWLLCVLATAATAAAAAAAGASDADCVRAQTQELFLWTEWPGSYDPAGYYSQLLGFMASNCIGARINRLVLRVLHPEHPSPGESFWWPPAETTPFYAHFLSKLPSLPSSADGVTLVVYPYVMEELAGRAWMRLSQLDAAGGPSNPVEGVYEFIRQWNAFLSGASGGGATRVRLSGAVFDLEENAGLRSYAGMEVTASVAQAVKAKNTGGEGEQYLSFEVTTGFDVLSKMREPAFDKVYGQFYDFYAPEIFAAQSATDSPFVVHKDDAAAMAAYVRDEAVGPGLLAKYADVEAVREKLLVMWSNQNVGGGDGTAGSCLFGDGNGRCGINYEFGVWSAKGFADFLQTVKAGGAGAVLGELQHGLFQFSFTPPSWV